MGGSVSSGRTNDELVDNLVESLHIKSPNVEKVFRAVDRGLFYLPAYRDIAYRDLAWREGNIHISAPCIYSEVMEALQLNKSGLSFLNIGSGTGYLSTMVGCLLGTYGINHNIEIHKDVIEHAKQCISDFIKNSPHFDVFNFCMPKFIHGNFLNINITNDALLYDRIYVGTGVAQENIEFIKSLLKVNGIIVAPFNELVRQRLIQITRVSDTEYETKNLMSVSFANMINENLNFNSINLPKVNPYKLQELCRYRVRELIRGAIEQDYPNAFKLVSKKSKKTTKEREEDTDEGYESYRNRIHFQNSLTDAQFQSMIHRRLLIHNYTEHEGIDDDINDDQVIENNNANVNTNNPSHYSRSSSRRISESNDSNATRRVSVIAVPISNNNNDEANGEFNFLVVDSNNTETRQRLISNTNEDHNGEQIKEETEEINRDNDEKTEPIDIKDDESNSNSDDDHDNKTNHMKERILKLTIPNTIKAYLLYNRDI